MPKRAAMCLVLLAAALPAPAQAAFPGDNGRVAFSSQGDLWSVNPNGSDPRPLTDTAVAEAQAAFSPDGTRIAFRRKPDGETAFQVYVMNADGSDQRRVTFDTDRHATQPGWSADGTRLLYRRATPGENLSGDVWSVGADGTGPRALVTTPGADERYPVSSPDGTRFAFTSSREGAQFDIFVASADGCAPTRLTTDPGYDSAPSWSPDASRLAFERGAKLDVDPTKDVWIMDADGSDQAVLAATPGVVDEGPAFSPDGTQIVFTTARDGNNEIYRMAANGLSPAPVLVRTATKEESPDWQALPAAAGAPAGQAPAECPKPPPPAGDPAPVETEPAATSSAGTGSAPVVTEPGVTSSAVPPSAPVLGGLPAPAPSPTAAAPATDRDRDGLSATRERVLRTSDEDRDTDDDGLSDGREVRARTRPDVRDTDRDRLADGLELGVRRRVSDPAGPVRGTAMRGFRADRDPRTRTDPRRRDTDRDGATDGREDRNANGRRDRGESDPRRR